MITRIEATEYRCFERLDVDLAELGVVVGANGAGKTTLLDIPVLLGDLLTVRNVSLAFLEGTVPRGPRASSLGELVYKNRSDRFSFAVEARLPERVVQALLEGVPETIRQEKELWPSFVRYELRLRVADRRALQVQSEYLFIFSEKYKPTIRWKGTGESTGARTSFFAHFSTHIDGLWSFWTSSLAVSPGRRPRAWDRRRWNGPAPGGRFLLMDGRSKLAP